MLDEEKHVRKMIRLTCINGNTRDAQRAITALVKAVREDCAKVVEEGVYDKTNAAKIAARTRAGR